jgi:hypothetical protein
MLAAGLAALQVQRGKMHRAMQPTGDDRFPAKLTPLPGERDEGRLRGFLRQLGIPELTHCPRVNDLHMSRHQFADRFLGAQAGAGIQQFHVAKSLHFFIGQYPVESKRDNLFASH